MRLLAYILFAFLLVGICQASKGKKSCGGGKKGGGGKSGKGGKSSRGNGKSTGSGGKKYGGKRDQGGSPPSSYDDKAKKCRRALKSYSKSEKKGSRGGQPFDSGFYIAYAGPEDIYDESNVAAIEYLQTSIQTTYNDEIGCAAGIFAESVQLENQTLLSTFDVGAQRDLQSKFGLAFSLLNFYKVSGRCGRTCPRGNRLVGNDAVRRSLRDLQELGGVEAFNTQIVIVLNRREEYSEVTTASISDDFPDLDAEVDITDDD